MDRRHEAASFLKVDGVAYAQSPNAGNPVGANWLWAWAMAVPAGRRTPGSQEVHRVVHVQGHQGRCRTSGFRLPSVPTGTRSSTYAYPEFKAVAKFAAAEMAAIESAAPEATDLKPYVGVQFAAIPEFQSYRRCPGNGGSLVGCQVGDALAASQATATAIMSGWLL